MLGDWDTDVQNVHFGPHPKTEISDVLRRTRSQNKSLFAPGIRL